MPKGRQIKITSKRGVIGFTSLILACTTVDFEKFCHGMPLSEVNNAVDSRPLLLAATMEDTN